MKRHYICLTIDTDPDGLSGVTTNREAISFEGFGQLLTLSDRLEEFFKNQIPLTWFVRCDSQLEHHFGTPLYLLEKYRPFFEAQQVQKNDIGWHPHLYRQGINGTEIITETAAAADELERLHGFFSGSFFRPVLFRNGEGWMQPALMNLLERMGILVDSSAIPGKTDDAFPLRSWTGSPNHPFYPRIDDHTLPGPERKILEVPMTSWMLKASYDSAPRIRYLNPAVHNELFESGLKNMVSAGQDLNHSCYVWVLIFHPDEVMNQKRKDMLYSFSMEDMMMNLHRLKEHLSRNGNEVQFVNLTTAASAWKEQTFN